jgi:hypothetical protein
MNLIGRRIQEWQLQETYFADGLPGTFDETMARKFLHRIRIAIGWVDSGWFHRYVRRS